jgi:hypothetical protein
MQAPGYSLSVVAGSNVSDTNILTFSPVWSLSGLCGWFSTSGSPQMLQWELDAVQVSMFSFRYDLNDHIDLCEFPDGLRLISTACNSTAIMVSVTLQQIVVTYRVTNQAVPLQQLIFPQYYDFPVGLINITISGASINIFTTPLQIIGTNYVYTGTLEGMDECVSGVDEVLMGPSCSSLEMFNIPGFYAPPSPHFSQGVSKGWMYATMVLSSFIALCLTVAGLVFCDTLRRRREEGRPLLAVIVVMVHSFFCGSPVIMDMDMKFMYGVMA